MIFASYHLLNFDAQFVFLGGGEKRYADALLELRRALPEKVGVETNFSDRMEHRLMAGSDMFLMPSVYEPCGLTQMRAQRYGTLPVGRRVGGIADTVEDDVTGFLFDKYDAVRLPGGGVPRDGSDARPRTLDRDDAHGDAPRLRLGSRQPSATRRSIARVLSHS